MTGHRRTVRADAIRGVLGVREVHYVEWTAHTMEALACAQD